MLPPGLEDYYEAQFDMMASRGWKDLCEDVSRIVKSLNDVTTVTPDTLLNRQGRIAELQLLLNRNDILSNAYKDLQDGTASV